MQGNSLGLGPAITLGWTALLISNVRTLALVFCIPFSINQDDDVDDSTMLDS